MDADGKVGEHSEVNDYILDDNKNDDRLSMGSYTAKGLKEHCSDPMMVALEKPSQCCQRGAGGTACFFLQQQADTPKIQVRLAGIEIKTTRWGSEPKLAAHCYTTRGSSTGVYVDMSFVLPHEMFDRWDDDEFLKDAQSLIDVSPTYIGHTVTCEMVKGEGWKREVVMKQDFDFDHIMKNCHESEKPEFGERSDMWADSYHRRLERRRRARSLLGGGEDGGPGDAERTYDYKKVAESVVGAKKCCFEAGPSIHSHHICAHQLACSIINHERVQRYTYLMISLSLSSSV